MFRPGILRIRNRFRFPNRHSLTVQELDTAPPMCEDILERRHSVSTAFGPYRPFTRFRWKPASETKQTLIVAHRRLGQRQHQAETAYALGPYCNRFLVAICSAKWVQRDLEADAAKAQKPRPDPAKSSWGAKNSAVRQLRALRGRRARWTFQQTQSIW